VVCKFLELVHEPVMMYSAVNHLSLSASYTRRGEPVPVATDVNKDRNVNVTEVRSMVVLALFSSTTEPVPTTTVHQSCLPGNLTAVRLSAYS